jgi:putative aminopeptidase FrvX
VVERLEYVASELKMPLQHEAASAFTGTDTDDIFNSRQGVASALVSLPMRYMHSSVETVDMQDVQRCVELLVGFVESVKDGEKFRVEI